MKVRVTVPELTEDGKKYVAGKTLDIDSLNRVNTLIRQGYVQVVDEEDAANPAVEQSTEPVDEKQKTPANKGRTANNKEA